MQLKALVVGSKRPKQSAQAGAKTTSPFLAVVAPSNFLSEFVAVRWLAEVLVMLTQLKPLVAGSNTPMQSMPCGAKMMSPLLAAVPP